MERAAAGHWDYIVANSVLRVTGLYYSNPPDPFIRASISAEFAPQVDFSVDALMGWDGGEGMSLQVLAADGAQPIAAVEYYDGVIVTAWASGRIIGGRTATDGLHSIAINRLGAELDIFLDGTLLGRAMDTSGVSAEGVRIRFSNWGSGPANFIVKLPVHLR